MPLRNYLSKLKIILRLKRRLVFWPIKNVDGCPCCLKFGHVKLGQGGWLLPITQPNGHAWHGRLSNTNDTLASPNHVNRWQHDLVGRYMLSPMYLRHPLSGQQEPNLGNRIVSPRFVWVIYHVSHVSSDVGTFLSPKFSDCFSFVFFFEIFMLMVS